MKSQWQLAIVITFILYQSNRGNMMDLLHRITCNITTLLYLSGIRLLGKVIARNHTPCFFFIKPPLAHNRCFWNSINKLLISATAPNTSFAPSNEWYLIFNIVANFPWSSSSTPVDSFCDVVKWLGLFFLLVLEFTKELLTNFTITGGDTNTVIWVLPKQTIEILVR